MITMLYVFSVLILSHPVLPGPVFQTSLKFGSAHRCTSRTLLKTVSPSTPSTSAVPKHGRAQERASLLKEIGAGEHSGLQCYTLHAAFEASLFFLKFTISGSRNDFNKGHFLRINYLEAGRILKTLSSSTSGNARPFESYYLSGSCHIISFLINPKSPLLSMC